MPPFAPPRRALLPLLALPMPARPASGQPAAPEYRFRVLREGSQIGTHRVSFASGAGGEQIVDQKRGGEAGDDHDLLHGGHASANARRCHFRDVSRGEHTGGAHSHAA